MLGFVRQAGRSRWLTDDEICRGVLRAIGTVEPEPIVVGQVEPWSARP